MPDDHYERLLSRRQSLRGRSLDGDIVTLSVAVARKLYRCPGCGGPVEVGSSHVLVRYPEADPPFYQHWHRTCALGDLMRSLRDVHDVPADPRPSPRARRRDAKARRRRR